MQPISNWYEYHRYRDKKAPERSQRAQEESLKSKSASLSLLATIFNMLTK